MHTQVPISPPSCISLPPSLSHPSRWSQSTELISLCYAAASHQPTISYPVVYVCRCYSHFAPPAPRHVLFLFWQQWGELVSSGEEWGQESSSHQTADSWSPHRALSAASGPRSHTSSPEPSSCRLRIWGLTSFRSDGLARSAGRGDLPALRALEMVNMWAATEAS